MYTSLSANAAALKHPFMSSVVPLQQRVDSGVVCSLEFLVVRLDRVVLELVHPPLAGPGRATAADHVLVRAADGGLGVVGGLARRPDEAAAFGRGGALHGHGVPAGLALRVDQAAVDGEHPPVLTALATHRAKASWFALGFVVCGGNGDYL
jgi:hypothetical protein